MLLAAMALPGNPIRYATQAVTLGLLLLGGCGTTKTRLATEQLLMSDAVDRTIARLDFSPLTRQKVFFETKYINDVKNLGFVNSAYVISALRQQMLAHGCLLCETEEEAEYVIEGRIGALGTDGHEVIYGIPASNGINSAATLLPNSPPIPAIPEIAVAKKEDLLGAAKIAVFAYHRTTREPVWQSGVAVSTSNAKDAWIFGAGPFQYGSIYDGTQFAGARLPLFGSWNRKPSEAVAAEYYHEQDFRKLREQQEQERGRLDRDIEAIVRLPKLFPTTEEMLERPTRLPRAELVAEKPEQGSAAAAHPAPAEPQPAAGPPAASAPAPDASAAPPTEATIVR